MSSPRTYNCYSCLESGPSEQFLGMCKCTEYRGVCEKCVRAKIPMSKWANKPTPGHHLMYVPRLSDEYKLWYDENVCEPMGGDNWAGCQGNSADDTTTYTYFECEGITNRKELNERFDGKLSYDQEFRDSCRRTLTVKNFIGEKFRRDDMELLGMN